MMSFVQQCLPQPQFNATSMSNACGRMRTNTIKKERYRVHGNEPTFARSAISIRDFSSFTSAIMIGVFDKSLSAFLPISCKTASNFSRLRPAMPHVRPSNNLTPSKIVYFPAVERI